MLRISRVKLLAKLRAPKNFVKHIKISGLLFFTFQKRIKFEEHVKESLSLKQNWCSAKLEFSNF